MHYLTLGDGDFSFSLDLAQYLYSEKNDKAANDIFLAATSVDSAEGLRTKYHDFEFISSKLITISKNISIHHNINAIVNDFDKSIPKDQFQHVIFNHPHIGTENASLHNRFLSHFFHSCYYYWLKPAGIIHLTLVKEQCERWFCLESASKQGFILLNRVDFTIPPSSDGKDAAISYYQHRRHQSGKGFAARTEGSEVLTFGRKVDQNNFLVRCLPWYDAISVNKVTKTSKHEKRKVEQKITDDKPFQCNKCSKKFREERSLKNHIQNMHRTNLSNEVIKCEMCVPPRIFSTKEALHDHKLSKHSGQFTNIKPDWCASKMGDTCVVVKSKEVQNFGCCSICLQSYNSMKEKDDHLLQFVPPAEDVKEAWKCNICCKTFREERALLQHSNHCNLRHLLSVKS